ncbi:MAG: 2,3-bisphosphoglycerate-independent phosphoglycerate mutase [Candidatus Aenigmatarchaeota archaeon]
MKDKKALFIVLDGIGGRPTDSERKTCLQKAETPNLDKLSEEGISGMLHPLGRGVVPGSDTSHLALFGYDPKEVYDGRGVFEASGIGMDVEEGDVCFRTNFATMNENHVLQDRRAGRIQEGQEKLTREIEEMKLDYDVEFQFRASTEHRGALVLKGENLSGNITDTDPHETNIKLTPARAEDKGGAAKRTAQIANQITERSYEILKDAYYNVQRKEDGKMPANVLLLRGAAQKRELEDFKEKYGIEGAAVAGGALYLGVAREIGLEAEKPEGATGGQNTDLENKIEKTVEKLQQNDFVFLHIKGMDNAGHDGKAEEKTDFIEKVDEAIGKLKDKIDWDGTHLCLTGDHSTPPSAEGHTSDPVPIIYCGEAVRKDKVKKFDEISCADGGLGHMEGQDVLKTLFGYNNWLDKYGS